MCLRSYKVQELAAGAISWCASLGGKAKKGDLVCKLSKLATRGRHKQNAERDLQRMVSSTGYSIRAQIETISVHLWDPKESCIYEADLPASRWQCLVYTWHHNNAVFSNGHVLPSKPRLSFLMCLHELCGMLAKMCSSTSTVESWEGLGQLSIGRMYVLGVHGTPETFQKAAIRASYRFLFTETKYTHIETQTLGRFLLWDGVQTSAWASMLCFSMG